MPHETRSLMWIKRAFVIKNDRHTEHRFILIVGFPDHGYFLNVSIRQSVANYSINERLDFVHRSGLLRTG